MSEKREQVGREGTDISRLVEEQRRILREDEEEEQAKVQSQMVAAEHSAVAKQAVARALEPMEKSVEWEQLMRLQFCELPRSTPEEIQRTIAEMERIYNQGLIPGEILKKVWEGKTEDFRKDLEEGGFLSSFSAVRSQLEHDLPEGNYFAYGLRDPIEGNRLVAYATGYYPFQKTGRLGIAESREGELVNGLPVSYKGYTIGHLDRIDMGNEFLFAAWENNTDRIILFDTVGVEFFDEKCMKGTGRGRGKKIMYETCVALMKRLPKLPIDEDYWFLSYRFYSILPCGADGKPSCQWQMAQEYTYNSASHRLFKDFRTVGWHRDLLFYSAKTGERWSVPGGQSVKNMESPSGELVKDIESFDGRQYLIIWLNEYLMLADAYRSFKRQHDELEARTHS